MSTSRNFGVNPREYSFYSTIACIDVLRGIMVKDDFESIMAKSQVIRDYLDRASSISAELYRTSEEGLRTFYDLNKYSDEEECQQLVRNLIDDFSVGRELPGVSYVQRDFAKVIAFLAEQYGCKDVFDPFAGRATFAEFLPENITYSGQEIDPQLCMLANLRLESQYRKTSSVENVDSFKYFHRSDMIVGELPFGLRGPERQTVESFFLQEASFHASKISVGIYPYGILLRQGKEGDLRKKLVESDLIDYVIKLPARLYAPSTNVQTCIIITNRHKRDEGYVRFIDASSFFVPGKVYTRLNVERLLQVLQNTDMDNPDVIWVNSQTLINHDCSLVMEHYQSVDLPEVPSDSQLVPLKYLLERISRRKPTRETMVPLIRVSDLAINPLDSFLASFKVDKHLYRPTYVYLDEPALLISRLRPLKPTSYVEDGRESGRGVYINPNVYAFRVRGEVSVPYLLNELTKEYVRKQLIYSGVAVPVLTVHDFLDVKILLPSLEKQNLSVVQDLQEEKERGDKEVMGAKRVMDAEMRQRAHTLGHPITSIGRLARDLADLMQQQGGVLHAKDIVDLKGETVEEKMEKLLYEYDRADYLRKNLMFAREFGEPQPIILYDFIAEYIRRHDLPKFKPTFIEKNRDFRILFAPEDLTTVLDNVFSNIGKYSFPADGFSPENQVAIDIQGCELNDRPAVSLLIMSSGEPLDASLNPEDVFMWGYSSSKEPDHGFGGNQIKMAVEHFRGEVSFLTEANLKDGFITAYRIVLPLISE